jgi:hypothetical protein
MARSTRDTLVAIIAVVVAWAAILIWIASTEAAVGIDNSEARIVTLLAAIRQVESGGDAGAVGDGGRSRGPFQISRAYWTDGCRQLESEGLAVVDYDQGVTDTYQSARVVLAYWRRWARGPLDAGDLQALARIHNGGPRGDRKASTLAYWRRVEEAMGDGD